MGEMENTTRFTNVHGIDLSLAVWLVDDDYDFRPGDKSISATGILKPTRQIVLGRRARALPQETPDLADLFRLRGGHAFHDAIERSWIKGYKRAMRLMGIPEKSIAKVKINPEPGEVTPDDIPVYLELRSERQIGEFTVSGKMDMCLNGRLKDVKTTSVYTFLKGRKDEDYKLQLSIYKWLNPDKVNSDQADIQFIFTDWQRAMSYGSTDYPKIPAHSYTIDLMSDAETSHWLQWKINEVVSNMNTPEEQLPYCSDEDLWRSEPVWKYYSDPNKTTGRASKNFDDLYSANLHLSEKGKGVVIMKPGEVKACGYCPAFNICSQKDQYLHD